jgi:hypothetical protein
LDFGTHAIDAGLVRPAEETLFTATFQSDGVGKANPVHANFAGTTITVRMKRIA